MRVAALYDIHGNIDALDAVLAEVEAERVDRMVIGGDVAWGPFPAEVLARLRRHDAHWLRGNTDRDIAAVLDEGGSPGNWVKEMDRWCSGRLTEEERTFLSDLPGTLAVAVDGLGEALFCHGTPRSEDEIITAITPDEEVAAALDGVKQDIVVCGHTHSQFDRTIGSRRLVNAGSVGLPYEDEPGARWAIIGPEVTFKRTEYDVAAAVARVNGSECPAAEWFAGSLSAPTPRDEAIETFEKRRKASPN